MYVDVVHDTKESYVTPKIYTSKYYYENGMFLALRKKTTLSTYIAPVVKHLKSLFKTYTMNNAVHKNNPHY